MAFPTEQPRDGSLAPENCRKLSQAMVWYYRKINRHDTGLTFKADKKLRIEIDGVDAGVSYYKKIRKVEMIKRAGL